MKKEKTLLFVFLMLFAFGGCKKETTVTDTRVAEPELASMVMRFYRHLATDTLAMKIPGIAVHLYGSQSDRDNNTNQIGASLTPDALGQVFLPSGLAKKTYFWWAEIDASCIYNTGSVNVSTNVGYNTYAELTSPDSMHLFTHDTCTSCNVFNVYMKSSMDAASYKGTFVAKMNPTDTTYIANLPIGLDSVRITRDTTLRRGIAGLVKDTTGGLSTALNGLVFTATTPFTLHSIDIYNSKSRTGSIKIELDNSAGTPLTNLGATANPYTVSSLATGKNTIVLDWNIPALTDMRLVKISGTADSLAYTAGGAAVPYPFPIMMNGTSFGNITSGYSGGVNTDYYLAYDWNTQFVLHPKIDTTFAVTINCRQLTTTVYP